MYENIALFQTSGALAKYASLRQNLIATNIANADTPNYRAQRIGEFQHQVDARIQRNTRAGHLS